MKILILVLALSFQTFATEVKVYTEDKPAANYLKDGKLTGISVEIVQEIMKRIKSTTAIEVLPWARAYDTLQKDANVALFSTSRTEQRENLFKWVGPVVSKDWVLMAKRDSKIKINSIEDAKKVRLIGTYREDSKEQYLKSLNFTNLESVSEDNLNPKKLLSNRIDLWITAKSDYKLAIDNEKLNPKDFRIAFTVKKQDLFIAFSKQTDDATVKVWQKAYDSMVKDGSLAKIRAQHPEID